MLLLLGACSRDVATVSGAVRMRIGHRVRCMVVSAVIDGMCMVFHPAMSSEISSMLSIASKLTTARI